MVIKKKFPYGFGRIEKADSRDNNYLMSAVVPKTSTKTSQFWDDNGYWGYQDGYPYCVGYAWAHWVEDAPIEHEGTIDPVWIYKQARLVDEFPGENYDGTTVRAGAKVLQKQKGLISNYYWAETVDDVVKAVLEVGPVVVGTKWYKNMSTPDIDGFIKPTGALHGSHAYVINGVDTVKGFFRIKNSWGRLWGQLGRAYIKIEDFAKLLKDGGEACIATEVPDVSPQKNWFTKFVEWLKKVFKR